MPAESILAGLATEQTLDSVAKDATLQAIDTLTETMVLLLSAMLEKMPRVSGNDQCAVVPEGGTISQVGTVTNVLQVTGRYVAHAPEAFSAMDASRIYNNIIVS